MTCSSVKHISSDNAHFDNERLKSLLKLFKNNKDAREISSMKVTQLYIVSVEINNDSFVYKIWNAFR